MKFILPIIIFIVIIGLVILAYWGKFWEKSISNDIAQWGQFWDYIWGLLNPIIGLINLFVIIYFWYYGFIKDKESQKIQMMPLVHIEYEQSYNENWELEEMWVFIKNSWFWPMIVKDIKIISEDENTEHKSYDEIVKNFPTIIRVWSYYNWKEWIIDKWEVRYLVKIRAQNNKSINKEWFDYFTKFWLKIIYKDIFNTETTIVRMPDELFEWAEFHTNNQ